MNARQPRKPGLYDKSIAVEKQLALTASYAASGASKGVLMVMMYGGRPKLQTDLVRALQARTVSPLECHERAHSFTEHGDYTNCFRRGI